MDQDLFFFDDRPAIRILHGNFGLISELHSRCNRIEMATQAPLSAAHGENSPDMSMDKEQGAMEPKRTWKQYLHTEVSNKNTDYLMLACCVISGLSDSTIYNGMLVQRFNGSSHAWKPRADPFAAYGTFVSMQTG